MAAIPYMPLYIADYLADAAHLTTAQHGAYLLLLMNYWQRGKPLPVQGLENITRMSPREWKENREVLASFFTESEGLWIHKRVEFELALFRGKAQQASSAAHARWQKRNADAMRPHSDRMKSADANAVRTECHTDTDTDTDKSKPPSPSQKRVRDEVDVWYRNEFYPLFPLKKASADGLKAARSLLNTEDLREKAMEALRAQLPELLSREKSRRPYPATWIRGRRWEDEVIAPENLVIPFEGHMSNRPHPGLIGRAAGEWQ